ncbi:lytic transglycosylase catalytic subunit [Catenovulum agarivorans DS-2]|uniref:Lytic transglycosylase catalytic subunit n=1 Tax=Catenovulum agarivorans DS-2 TaxID=1328313 RepID=W7QFB0_9ALTE|nr:murein transglycosylase domain-containing protein [Catenovulum agarivorans]EWH11589.1 lytic transglycosylase catalytic subunit [Catenovulum agarivorans DS-2]
MHSVHKIIGIGALTVYLMLPVHLPANDGFADADDDFAAIDAMLDKQFAGTDVILERRFNAVEQAVERALKGLSNKIEVNWGAQELKLPSAHEWVDYTPDMQTRRMMDFEAGQLSIETVIQPNQSVSEVVFRLKQALTTARTDTTTHLQDKDQLGRAIQQELAKLPDRQAEANNHNRANATLPAQTDKPVLDNLVSNEQIEQVLQELEKLEAQNTIDDEQISQSTDAVAETRTVQVAQQPAKVIRINIPFLSGYQNELIQRNFSVIKRYSDKYNVPVSLVLAIIETESSFNPRATSPVPAFGLMQLVPRTAGIDAYRHVYGEKRVVEPEYLYNSEQNIELGVAYFDLLTTRYLRKVKDPLARFYCAVASYNTGVGNVAKTFTKNSKNFSKAAKIINKQSAEQVYQYLSVNLPALETRRYLDKVTKAKKRYAKWDEV